MTRHAMESPTAQNPLPLLGGVARSRIKVHTTTELLAIADERELAIEMIRCDPIRGRGDGFYADHLEIDRSPWSKMLRGIATSRSKRKPRFALTAAEWDILEKLTQCPLIHERWKAIRKNKDLVERQLTVEDKAAMFDAMTTERAELAQRSA